MKEGWRLFATNKLNIFESIFIFYLITDYASSSSRGTEHNYNPLAHINQSQKLPASVRLEDWYCSPERRVTALCRCIIFWCKCPFVNSENGCYFQIHSIGLTVLIAITISHFVFMDLINNASSLVRAIVRRVNQQSITTTNIDQHLCRHMAAWLYIVLSLFKWFVAMWYQMLSGNKKDTYCKCSKYTYKLTYRHLA